MIGGLLAGIAGSAWVRAALRYGLTALAILLFLLSLRRSGERAGRLAERLESMEKANDSPTPDAGGGGSPSSQSRRAC